MLWLVVSAAAADPADIIEVTTTAQQVNADADCSLQEAIYAANLDDNIAPAPGNPGSVIDTGCTPGDGSDTIGLPSGGVFNLSAVIDDAENHVGPAATPIVTSAIVIDANGARVSRAPNSPSFRAFAVSESGSLMIDGAHVAGFHAQGGAGSSGGGGGLGAGGAIYVHGGALTVENSTFERNGADGGRGATTFPVGGGSGGGGGGGLGGKGGSAAGAGGGGGGSRGDGAAGRTFTDGGGGGGRVTDAAFRDGGTPCGGAGGDQSLLFLGLDGEPGACAGGGGGGGADDNGVFDADNDGGDGAYGGGGGGGGRERGDGGHGGFGAGGGGSGHDNPNAGDGGGSGGDGGFGGGGAAGPGGAVFGGPGTGGTFAGHGGDASGGGGAALGGAIFGHEATITIRNTTFSGNYVARGVAGGPDADQGTDSGGAVFLVAGTLTVLNSTVSGNESTGDGAGIVVYKPTTGQTTSLTLRNTVVADNTGVRACFVRNGAAAAGSGNLIELDGGVFSPPLTGCPGIEQTDDPQLGPLQINGPGVTPTRAIPLTSPAVDAADSATSLPVDQRGVPRPQGAGYDIGAYEAGDLPPVTTITLTPAAPNGSNGWYRTTVAIGVTANDPDGSIGQTRCALDPTPMPASFDDLPDAACALSSVSSDGPHTIHAASRDAAGTTETPPVSTAFKIDRTAPTLAPTLSTPTVTVGQTGVTALPGAADAPSGVATAGCDPIDATAPGEHTVTCTATDKAGNTASAAVAYLVEYRILGFFDPVPNSKWRVSTTVPVKVALGDVADRRLSDSQAAALATACRVRFSASGAQTLIPQCMKYDPAFDQFVYAWKLARNGTGPETIEVSVTYPNTTSTTRKTEQVTIAK